MQLTFLQPPTTPRHIIIKVVKVKDIRRILKAAKEKQLITHKRNPIDRKSVV